ncbi:MAG: serine/threonine protein kinase [Scytolyngbya sp. HA4215-MV1]|jgi:serine/threonine protein kinase|nr:serine/threonine protein kinase [Scytolyngbya sp. HA4215-MV1]
MNEFPDFTHQGYRVEQALGHNLAGGRITYLASTVETQQKVVIKQFQFAKTGVSWADYDAHDREVQLLKDLNHSGIPRYLNSFQTGDGFCLVQEYKPATSLATASSLNPAQIKTIAIATLEILVYLQNRIPPIIHRDIKPANILLDANSNVYLVDFGFAHVGEGEVGISSVVKGTLGFMPPEQLFNRQLTEGSDLYGLGMTLICLLTGTKADQVGNLVDITYRVSFKHLVPKLNMQWVGWLEKMVEPRLKDRFPNAVAALTAIPVSPLRPPEAQFSCSALEFSAHRAGDWLTQSVKIVNPIPETTLEGQWEIVAHPHDPAPEIYTWIAVEPATFTGNQVNCQITIDTRRLMAGKTYRRKLMLHTNTLAKSYPLTLQIQIANFSSRNPIPYPLLAVLGCFALGNTWIFTQILRVVTMMTASSRMADFGAIAGAGIGFEIAAWLMRTVNWQLGALACTLSAGTLGGIVLIQVLSGAMTAAGLAAVIGSGVGLLGGMITGFALGAIVETLAAQMEQKKLLMLVALLTLVLGFGFGLGLTIGFYNSRVLTVIAISSLLLFLMFVQQSFRLMELALSHRKTGRSLIKP